MALNQGEPPPDAYIKTHRITLDKIQIGARFQVSNQLLSGGVLTVTDMIDQIIGMQLRGYIYGRKHSRHEFAAPLNWIEAIKERWLPKWARKRWPVQYRREVLDVKELYPTLKYDVPDHAPVLHIEVAEPWNLTNG